MINNYKLGDAGSEVIKHYEGLRLKAYQPVPGDHWTIGWGSTKGVYEGLEITIEEAEKRFKEDVGWAETAVNRLVCVPISQAQFDALVSFTFNTGAANFETSTLLRLLNECRYDTVDHQLARWVWGGRPKQKLDGLIKRRRSEAELFEDYAPRLVNFTNHASKVHHEKDEHRVRDTVAESRTAKTGAALIGAGGLNTGLDVMDKMNEIGSSATTLATKFGALMDPSLIIPLILVVGIGGYLIYLKHSDKKTGRSY